VKRSLALNEVQLRLVQRAATHLPPEQREGFLRSVAARLGQEPSPLAVETAILGALEHMPGFATKRQQQEVGDDHDQR
jgi:hypothetical protein